MKLDASLYLAMLLLTGIAGILATDEAAKWIDAQTLWFLRSGVTLADAVVTGMKAFTSRGFADWLEKKKQAVPAPTSPETGP